MSDTTAIQWTNRTWNPWRGCTKIHARCARCYMFTEQTRYGQDPSVVVRTKTWNDPLRWQKNAAKLDVQEMVFTCSWSDWFHKDADDWRDEAWDVVKRCPNLTFQILTKRPDRIADHLPKDWGDGYPNVWLGSSLDPQDENGMELFKIPSAIRFLSLEPLLGPVDLAPALLFVHWIIVGGESGPNSRACDIQWIRSIVAQCKAAGVSCFVKQLGAFPVTDEAAPDGWPGGTELETNPACTSKALVRLKHKKGGDMEEWPLDLRVRQFPKV